MHVRYGKVGNAWWEAQPGFTNSNHDEQNVGTESK